MKKLLETPATQFELPDGLDYIFDNTPISSEDIQRITEMIQKLKTESTDSLSLKLPEKKEQSAQIVASKEKALSRRRERYAAQKAQKPVYTEGVS